MYQLLLTDYKITEPELFIQIALDQLDVNYKLLATVIDFYPFTNKFLIDLAIDNLTNDELLKMIFYKMHHTYRSTIYLKFKYKLRDFITQRDSLLNDQFDNSSEEEFDLDGYMRSSMTHKIFEPQSSTSEECLGVPQPTRNRFYVFNNAEPEVIIDGVSKQQLKIMKKYKNIEIDNTLSHTSPEMVDNLKQYESDNAAKRQLTVDELNKAASDRAAKQQLRIDKALKRYSDSEVQEQNFDKVRDELVSKFALESPNSSI